MIFVVIAIFERPVYGSEAPHPADTANTSTDILGHNQKACRYLHVYYASNLCGTEKSVCVCVLSYDFMTLEKSTMHNITLTHTLDWIKQARKCPPEGDSIQRVEKRAKYDCGEG